MPFYRHAASLGRRPLTVDSQFLDFATTMRSQSHAIGHKNFTIQCILYLKAELSLALLKTKVRIQRSLSARVRSLVLADDKV